MTSVGLSLLLYTVAIAASRGDSETSRQPPIPMGDHRQLFVDDYVISQMEGVSRVLNQPRKHPDNPLVRVEHPWDGDLMDMYGAVVFDEVQSTYKMWYVRYSVPFGTSGCYATSPDGIHWQKPALGLVDFQGSKANNLVPWLGMGMVYSAADSDPNARYKALAGRIAVTSPDGLVWQTPAGSEAIPGDLASDHVIPFCYDELGDQYLAFPKVNRKSGKHSRRSIAIAVSDDFLTWSEARTILVPDERDDELARARIPKYADRLIDDRGPELHNAQFYGMCGFPYEGMYLGMLWVFDVSGFMKGHPSLRVGGGGEEGITQVELVCSRDLKQWERVADREVFIPLGEDHAWDAATIYTANRPLIAGDEIWIYYGAHAIGHGHPLWRADAEREQILREATVHGPISGVGLARLRLDGWVSIDAGSQEGALTTKPFACNGGRRLEINAKTLDGGFVKVEILDESGTSIRGFGKEDCRPFKGDAVRHVVVWGERVGPADSGGKVR